ncbi:MAG: HEAT repeat protein [Verrucomicrobiales bacterium]|jgi:HEAT repeat protein
MRFLVLALWLVVASQSLAQDFVQLDKELIEGDLETRREAARQLRELGAGALPALPGLIRALQDDDEQVAARAMTAIARIGPGAPDAIPGLIEAMDPERRRYDEQVVFRSAYALGEIGEAAVEPLRTALQSKSDKRRWGAAQALGLIGEKAAAAVPELLVALGDSEPGVRGAVTEALGSIGAPAIGALIAGIKAKPVPAAVRAIGLIGEPARESSAQVLLLLASESDDQPLVAAAIGSAGLVGVSFAELRPVLRAALLSEEEAVRLAAANVLLGTSRLEADAIPALRSWIGDSDRTLRNRATWVAGQFGSDAADLAPLLVERIKAGDELDVFSRALAGIGAGACPAVLAAVAEISLPELRGIEVHWALQILRSAGPLALPALENALASDSAATRFVALDTLARLGKSAQPLLPKFRKASNDPDAFVRLAALEALGATEQDDRRLTTILSRRCQDESAQVRAVAVRLLGQSSDGQRTGFDLINAALADPDPQVRASAIGALAKFGATASPAVGRLCELAEGAGPSTRLAILNALTAIGSDAKAALPLVEASLTDGESSLRGAAIAAMVAIEPDAEGLTTVLEKMLKDPDEAVRHPAIEGLGQRGEDARSAAPQLFALLGKKDDRVVALEALTQIRPLEVDPYIEALRNDDPRVRLFACEALGRLGNKAAKSIPALEQLKRDGVSSVRRRAEDAIKRIRD